MISIESEGKMKVEKIVAKLKRTKFGHTFSYCEKVLLAKGYRLDRVKGSMVITIAKHRPMSPDAVKDVIKAWEE